MNLPESLRPRILFEDTHLVVLSKPAGLLSQGAEEGQPNLVDWLRGHFGRHYVGLVHRLDRNTSGVMVVGKRTKSANRLTESLQDGSLVRTYRALLEGRLEGARDWKHFLEKDERTNTVRVVRPPKGKEARLHVEPVAKGGSTARPLTLAEFRLDTGRSHQIRVQAAHEGLPLLGDPKYGRKTPPGERPYDRPALHSFRIEFPHPMGGEPLRFGDPVPAEWERFLQNG